MNLAEFSVKNSLLVNVFTILLVVSGIVALFNLKREAFPNISFDTVLITTNYAGATPEEIEKLITIPLEKELKEVDDIDEMQSASADGISIISLKIDEDADNKERIINDISRAVDRVEDFPQDLQEKPVVREIKTRNQPIIEISLAGELPEKKLQEYAKALERQITDISDIAKVSRRGWRDKEVWVEVSPQATLSYHLSLAEIESALRRHNVGVPGGILYENGSETTLRISGEIETAEGFGDVIIRANPGGNHLRVKDVATIREAFHEEKLITKTNGKRSVILTVVKKASGDTITLVEKLRKLVPEFQKGADPRLQISFVNDISYYIKRRLKVLTSNGWIGMVLVILSLFPFLSLRIAAGACLGIPTAVLTTFALMYWFGLSINLLSMFGLIIVIGMLVDEDIMVSENVHRHMSTGQSSEMAVIEGANEVRRSVVATVLTTIVAFVPLYLMSGIMGKFVRNIPMVVTLALLASLLEALFILPSHLADLTRGREKGRLEKFHKKVDEYFRKALASYLEFLKKCIRHRYRVAGVAAGLIVAITFYAIFGMKFVLFPSRGIEIFFIRVEDPVGTSLTATEAKLKPIEELIDSLPKKEMDAFLTQVGIVQNDPDDPFTNRGSHLGQITVYLSPESKRSRTAEEIIAFLRPEVEKISTFKKVIFDRVRPGPPVGKPLQVRIRGDDFDVLKEAAQNFVPDLEKMKGVADIKLDYEGGNEKLLVQVDPLKASQTSLSVQEIALAVREAYEGAYATTIKKGDEEIDVVVKFPQSARENRGALESLLVPNRMGNLIPLNRVAVMAPEEGLRVIKHYDGVRAVNITASIDEKITTPILVNKILAKKFKNIFAEKPGYTVHYGGEQEDTRESLASLFRAFAIAAGLILIILLFLFRSIAWSAIILLTIPLSFIGVVVAFIIHGLPLSFMALLGVVGLTGVIVDSGLILLDFIQRARKAGMPLTESILKGASLRFRAIILTSLTTAFGVLPSAYGIGGSDPFIQPMALALNYGLIFGTALSLIIVPSFVAIADDAGVFFKKWRTTKKEFISGSIGGTKRDQF